MYMYMGNYGGTPWDLDFPGPVGGFPVSEARRDPGREEWEKKLTTLACC